MDTCVDTLSYSITPLCYKVLVKLQEKEKSTGCYPNISHYSDSGKKLVKHKIFFVNHSERQPSQALFYLFILGVWGGRCHRGHSELSFIMFLWKCENNIFFFKFNELDCWHCIEVCVKHQNNNKKDIIFKVNKKMSETVPNMLKSKWVFSKTNEVPLT